MERDLKKSKKNDIDDEKLDTLKSFKEKLIDKTKSMVEDIRTCGTKVQAYEDVENFMHKYYPLFASKDAYDSDDKYTYFDRQMEDDYDGYYPLHDNRLKLIDIVFIHENILKFLENMFVDLVEDGTECGDSTVEDTISVMRGIMLGYGISQNVYHNDKGITALHMVAQSKNLDEKEKKLMTEFLLTIEPYLTNVNAKSQKIGHDVFSTPLILATKNDNAVVAKILLEQPNISVFNSDHHGRTAFMYAAANGMSEVVDILLADFWIDINAADNNGNTALMLAAKNSRDDSNYYKTLLSLMTNPQVDLNLRNNDGLTAFDLCSTPNCSLYFLAHINVLPLPNEMISNIIKARKQMDYCRELDEMNNEPPPQNTDARTLKQYAERLKYLKKRVRDLADEMKVPTYVQEELEANGTLCRFLSKLIGWSGFYDEKALQ